MALRREDPAPYRTTLLRASVESVSYYTAERGDRAEYLFELIGLAGDAEYFLGGLCSALETPNPEQSWVDRQLIFGLLRRFAAQGSDKARAAMYGALGRLDYESEFAGEVVWLDGEAGMLFAAAQAERCAVEDLAVERVCLLMALEEADPAVFARQRELPAAPWVAKAMADLDARRERGAASESPPNRPYSEIRRKILEECKGAGLGVWGGRATEAELRLAANDLLLETDPGRLLHYVRIFASRPFPDGHEALLPLVRHEVEEIAWAAVMAVSCFQHEDVRRLAEEFAGREDRHAEAIRLLARNARTEDWARVERWLDIEMDDTDYHDLGFAGLDFVESNLSAEAAGCLIQMYEHGACEYCRERVVKLLIGLGCLPEWMRDECRFDANRDIRALMGEKTPGRGE